MHPTTKYDYDSEMRYEHTHLAFEFWATPCVFPVPQHRGEYSEGTHAILKSNEMRAWLDHWIRSDGLIERQKEILKLRQMTSLPRDLRQIPLSNNGSTIVNKEKRMKYQRRKALQKEENWRNKMTMQMIEN